MKWIIVLVLLCSCSKSSEVVEPIHCAQLNDEEVLCRPSKAECDHSLIEEEFEDVSCVPVMEVFEGQRYAWCFDVEFEGYQERKCYAFELECSKGRDDAKTVSKHFGGEVQLCEKLSS